MKILNTDEKKVYDSFMQTITFTKTIFCCPECWDVPIPDSWVAHIKDLKIDESLRWSGNIND
tara:strand:+ start:159 stop:344 length:186 start_codon:yes stop_codon:yes gene_type:complete